MPRSAISLGSLAAAPCVAVALSVTSASSQTPTQTSPEAASASAVQLPDSVRPPAWLVADETGRTVTVALQVTHAPDGAPLINGRHKGDLQIIVPLGWTVQWDWRNADSTSPHSLVVMVQREKLPTEGGRAAFANAMTRMVTAGLTAGQGDRTTFTADEAGWYWFLCGVPGHAIAGEYLELHVDPDAKTAGVRLK
jgi:hypothetical protein